jgi:non-heme chloroperoxidase
MTAPVRDLATAVLVIALLAPALPTEAATVTHQAPSFVQVAPCVRIHVVRAGPASGTRAPALVLIPGWRLTTAVWREQIDRFSKDRTVIAIDPRSQGDSTKTGEGDTPEQRARDLHAVLKALAPGPVVLVGWSQGVQDVAAYVDQFGAQGLRGLILVDSTVSVGAAASSPQATAQQLKQISQFTRYPREATEGMMKAIIRSPLTPAQRARLIDDALKTPTAIGAAMLADDLLGPDRTGALSKFTVPTLVIASEFSQELDGQRAMAAKLPHARFEMVAGAGHAVFIDQPERFDALVSDFLATLS